MQRTQATNAKIAEDLGLSESMISRLRTKVRHPSVDTLRRIADAYDIEVSTLYVASIKGQFPTMIEEIWVRHYG